MEDIILKERSFKENIVQVVNNSELPAFIVKPILKDLFEQVSLLEQQQYEQAKKIKEEVVKRENKSKRYDKENKK